MERDRKIQRILTPAQFNLYVRFVREHPQRIHDYRGWYANPRYPDRRPSHDCRRYEDNYWNYRWGTIHHDNHWRDDRHDSDRHWDRDNHRHDYRKPAKPDKPKPKKNKKDRDDRKNGIIAMGERSNNSTIAWKRPIFLCWPIFSLYVPALCGQWPYSENRALFYDGFDIYDRLPVRPEKFIGI